MSSQTDYINYLLTQLMFAPHPVPNFNAPLEEWLASLEPLTAERVEYHLRMSDGRHYDE